MRSVTHDLAGGLTVQVTKEPCLPPDSNVVYPPPPALVWETRIGEERQGETDGAQRQQPGTGKATSHEAQYLLADILTTTQVPAPVDGILTPATATTAGRR